MMKERTRVSVTMTQAYVDALDHLVEEGIYLTKGEFILESVRNNLKIYGIKPFAKETEG